MNKYFVLGLYLLLTYSSNSQNFTERVKSFITADTTIVAIENITLIDGTGNALKNYSNL